MKNTPSIELCKKLKEAGYEWNNTTYVYDEDGMLWHMLELMAFWLPDVHRIAPKIAEIIDSLPREVWKYWLEVYKNKDCYIVCYAYHTYDWPERLSKTKGQFPDALAEMRLNLKEEGFIWWDDDDAKI